MKTQKEIIKAFEDAEVTEKEITSNEMKKGDLIVQANGWYGEILDNMKGNTRVANIHGYFTEAGSIYVWDITNIVKDGKLYNLKLTDKQVKDRVMVESISF